MYVFDCIGAYVAQRLFMSATNEDNKQLSNATMPIVNGLMRNTYRLIVAKQMLLFIHENANFAKITKHAQVFFYCLAKFPLCIFLVTWVTITFLPLYGGTILLKKRK